jgi:hypothetical protein
MKNRGSTLIVVIVVIVSLSMILVATFLTLSVTINLRNKKINKEALKLSLINEAYSLASLGEENNKDIPSYTNIEGGGYYFEISKDNITLCVTVIDSNKTIIWTSFK